MAFGGDVIRLFHGDECLTIQAAGDTEEGQVISNEANASSELVISKNLLIFYCFQAMEVFYSKLSNYVDKSRQLYHVCLVILS